MAWGWNRRAFGEARRLGLALLLLAAVIVRAGVPAGWMPNLDAGPRGELVICTGRGEAILHGKSEPAAPHSTSHHDVCAFSGLGAGPTPESPALHVPVALVRAADEPPSPQGAHVYSPRHREQAARAPPRLI